MSYDVPEGQRVSRASWYVPSLLPTALCLRRYPGALRVPCPRILGISVPETS